MVEVAIRAFEAVAPAEQTAGRLPDDLPSKVVWGPDDHRHTVEQQTIADAADRPLVDDAVDGPATEDANDRATIGDPAEEPAGGA
jgi:hypothetical protein